MYDKGHKVGLVAAAVSTVFPPPSPPPPWPPPQPARTVTRSGTNAASAWLATPTTVTPPGTTMAGGAGGRGNMVELHPNRPGPVAVLRSTDGSRSDSCSWGMRTAACGQDDVTR